MSWRTVIVGSPAKLSYQNNYLLVRAEATSAIHLSEVHTIIIDSTQVSLSTYLLSELMKRKVKLVFCDEKHNPQGEVVPYYGSHNTSKRVATQMAWDDQRKAEVWAAIVCEKIVAQASVLRRSGFDVAASQLGDYLQAVRWNDESNREGHAAKVYFNTLFSKDFTRSDGTDRNAALNYGYSIILSTFNKEVVARGYLTQVGINHRNEFNPFNLTSDLMEPFRPIVDEFVLENEDRPFDSTYRQDLVYLLSRRVRVEGGVYYLTNAISSYVESVLDALDSEGEVSLLHYEL